MPDPTSELPFVILDALRPISQRRILNRRGSAVWDVETETRRYAVKLGYPIAPTPEWPAQPWTALAPAREGAVFHRLDLDDIAYGEWELGTWNIQPWHEGPDLYGLWEPCRADGSAIEPHVSVALSCAKALARLHAQGWSHGDVQPAHFIIGPDRTHLIDLALAHGQPVPPSYDFPYRGCLVHYEAPEISRSILERGVAEPTPAADVYALGASLFISATGWRAVAYPDDASRPQQRKAIVNATHRPVNMAGPLGVLINGMLAYDIEKRPSIDEVVKALN
ncbi:protein kinase [Streptomyces beijiangensis]|uniref:Protein kinase n=1 Tax=Streptomyces beijiangensis TaxID=163361 RepID=A0A939JKM7_9ACTN|nr:protein kinase [Streptomyces beijiangensis]MBO0515987.1 protein kinase [Streptomyces beijiangensis]